ncbi:hypothetical protein N665_0193s0010 [Sinapis alba]|nr:hypothetical protein N665_0193s0010 [Sinapis alba]
MGPAPRSRGTGNTFLWSLLYAAIRYRGEICLNVASSGIASLLLLGGRTAHSRFGILINPDEFSTCTVKPGTDQAYLLKSASLIIWDEPPMMSKHYVGDGNIGEGNDGESIIMIRDEFPILDADDQVESISKAVYGDAISLQQNREPQFFQERAILCPTNEDVNIINQHMLDKLQTKVITGEKVGKIVLLPRLSITPSDKKFPFKMRRRQILIAVAFTITINKSQGQSFAEIGFEGKPQCQTKNVVFKEIFSNL